MKKKIRRCLLVALMMLIPVIGVTLGAQVALAGVEELDADLDRG